MRILFAFLTVSCFGQTVVNPPAITLSVEAVSAVNKFLSKQLSGSVATLTLPILVGDSVINVTSTASIRANGAVLIDGEVVQVTAKTATTLTVTRGVYGTTAAAHLSSAVVLELQYTYTGLTGFNTFLVSLLRSDIGNIMNSIGTASLTTQDAVINTANAAKLAVIVAAVQ